ncbi:nucleoside hydrolase [Blastococcus sp. BMG 814]|uniref:Nucleoside hydrolase n=1 Tax=Blastococcus carthaginiensis TaxID=3050034 RepID=A0ABT9I8X2_9ACTN|nr:nucleoside hydrolase [Blastococcus carthaginiensis]MDP5182013.1 nucleoside hydrolase [Blastococcus carthaginiensis]
MTTTRPVRVLLVVDTGVDDALALLLAVRHPGIEVLAVTCVAGNASLESAASRTSRECPVADRPMSIAAAVASTSRSPRPRPQVREQPRLGRPRASR